jgi:rhodanese-related sulfurtransferase
MNELGFENAYNLVGGILEWEGSSYSINHFDLYFSFI